MASAPEAQRLAAEEQAGDQAEQAHQALALQEELAWLEQTEAEEEGPAKEEAGDHGDDPSGDPSSDPDGGGGGGGGTMGTDGRLVPEGMEVVPPPVEFGIELMADLQLGPDWEKLWDPAHGTHYFFNNATQESRWLPPDEDEGQQQQQQQHSHRACREHPLRWLRRWRRRRRWRRTHGEDGEDESWENYWARRERGATVVQARWRGQAARLRCVEPAQWVETGEGAWLLAELERVRRAGRMAAAEAAAEAARLASEAARAEADVAVAAAAGVTKAAGEAAAAAAAAKADAAAVVPRTAQQRAAVAEKAAATSQKSAALAEAQEAAVRKAAQAAADADAAEAAVAGAEAAAAAAATEAAAASALEDLVASEAALAAEQWLNMRERAAAAAAAAAAEREAAAAAARLAAQMPFRYRFEAINAWGRSSVVQPARRPVQPAATAAHLWFVPHSVKEVGALARRLLARLAAVVALWLARAAVLALVAVASFVALLWAVRWGLQRAGYQASDSGG